MADTGIERCQRCCGSVPGTDEHRIWWDDGASGARPAMYLCARCMPGRPGGTEAEASVPPRDR
ncbi:hypothetical protein AB0G74_21680 [Streptomyces sp. NPDC020875]|uniref:hypothetical protein n=1 Tax=Streptomyces sp. NPDC020875 TaxID=3154898 RepID=UPI0033D86572